MPTWRSLSRGLRQGIRALLSSVFICALGILPNWSGHAHHLMLDLLAVNFLTLITEFAAISLALSALGISSYISVPVSAVGLTLMVVTGSYLRWERIGIRLCLMDLTCSILAFTWHPTCPSAALNS